ncbi:MAG TPA: cupin domain-containing protein [Solirubrobacteraceae bacterium]|nr:cupin domain-containing protein [Solirubrobacteraceae bacterium]
MTEQLPPGVAGARLDGEARDRFVRLRGPLGVTGMGLNVIVLEPGQRMRIHRHSSQEEVYVPLAGTLGLGFADGERSFRVGEIVRVAPEVRRQVLNRGPERLEVLIIGAMTDREHEPRDAEPFNGWTETEPGTLHSVPVPDDLPTDAPA